MLQVAQANLEDNFYGSAINRVYYAIFYAASALLLTKGESRSKHSGVISAFRKIFIKTGVIEVEYSDIYGKVMDARVDSDYDMVYEPDENATKKLLSDAQRFVDRAVTYLAAAGFKV
ncbi:MAG: HEPN domain-containing protein [Planctomycetes bacterium]|nr:HEPN domain-containing protein [Planctomycetota bacterium]